MLLELHCDIIHLLSKPLLLTLRSSFCSHVTKTSLPIGKYIYVGTVTLVIRYITQSPTCPGSMVRQLQSSSQMLRCVCVCVCGSLIHWIIYSKCLWKI